MHTFRGNRQTRYPIRNFDPAIPGLLEPAHEHVALLCDLVNRKRHRSEQDKRHNCGEDKRSQAGGTGGKACCKFGVQWPQGNRENRGPDQRRQKTRGGPHRKTKQDQGKHDPGVHTRAGAQRKRLAPEPALDIRGGRVAEHLARQILRRIEERGRRWRHDRSDVGTVPHDLLKAAAQGRRIDRRSDHRAHIGLAKPLDLLDHLFRVVVGQRNLEFKAPLLGGHRKALRHALHELTFVVLHKRQRFP